MEIIKGKRENETTHETVKTQFIKKFLPALLLIPVRVGSCFKADYWNALLCTS